MVCHGDYRLDNLVFGGWGAAPGQQQQQQQAPELLAVLDWELSTLGNRWADVAYMCLIYHLPPDIPVLKSLRTSASSAATVTPPPGIPTEQARCL